MMIFLCSLVTVGLGVLSIFLNKIYLRFHQVIISIISCTVSDFLRKILLKRGSFNLLCNIKSSDAINQCHENENFTKLKCLHYSCPPVKPGQLALELSNLAGLYLADGALGVAAPVPPLLFSGDHLYPLRMLVSGPPPRRLLVIIVSRGLMMRGSG